MTPIHSMQRSVGFSRYLEASAFPTSLNPIISFFSIESHLEPIRHREENKTFSVSGSYALVLLTAISLLANPIQSSAQLDTEFWFVAPEVWAGHGDAPILLRFSTLDEAASVTVDQPANPSFPSQNVAINANGTATLDLTTWLSLIENKPSNQVLQRGLRIVSSAPITAYYEVSHPLNTEIFTLKGEAAMGTNFFTPFQTNLSNFYPQSKSAIDVIASEDNTEVTVIPTANLTNHLYVYSQRRRNLWNAC
jgi:hypothetical protein